MGFDSIIGLVNTIVGRIWPDKSEQEKLQLAKELQQALLESDIAKGQLAVNTEEAKSTSVFVSGWRPFIGWVCGLAFSWQYLICPLLTFLIVVSGKPAPAMPEFGIETMMPVLVGMLGLGSLRTYEKIKGRRS